MLGRIGAIGLVVVLPVFVVGCATLQQHLGIEDTGSPLSAQVPDVNAPTNLDTLFTQVANQVPGFGGFFLDGHGELNVYLTDGPAQKAAAISAIAAVFSPHRPKIAQQAQQNIKVLQGQYDFAQLREWKIKARSLFSTFPEITALDADEQQNRVVIGVETFDVVASIEPELDKLNVPRQAVEFERIEPVRRTSHETLLDRVRPLNAGLLVSYNFNGGFTGLCTMGFLAERNGEDGFVVNSHCTDDQGGVEDTIYYQKQDGDPNDRVGIEVADPLYFTGGNCPSGKKCRYSDSAFVDIDADVSYDMDFIAKTTGNGSRTITHDEPFRISAQVGFPVGGETLHKIGYKTGWTNGEVSRTCTDFPANGTFAFLCQEWVTGSGIVVDVGDSGAPVFEITNDPENNDVAIYGINIGQSGDSTFVFSSITNIEGNSSELGTLSQCAPGTSGC